MHAINGYLYCNGPTLQLAPGDKLRTILMGFGSEVDMHSPIFAGQSLAHLGERHALDPPLKAGLSFDRAETTGFNSVDVTKHCFTTTRLRRVHSLLCGRDACHHVCCGCHRGDAWLVGLLLQHPGPHQRRHAWPAGRGLGG